jgi:hypothetical protein
VPLLAGGNLTDKGCLPVTDHFAQTTDPHNFSAVPPTLFGGCKATNSENATITVDPYAQWVSLNIISTAALQEMVISIDEHPLWVYEVDGHYIEPQLVDVCDFPLP